MVRALRIANLGKLLEQRQVLGHALLASLFQGRSHFPRPDAVRGEQERFDLNLCTEYECFLFFL